MREGRFSAEEMKRRAARESLERYTHYYERYHAHDVSRKEAARLLAESVSDHLRRVSTTTQIAESQLKFIIEVCSSVACSPGRVVLSGMQNVVLTDHEFVYLRVPSCRALVLMLGAE